MRTRGRRFGFAAVGLFAATTVLSAVELPSSSASDPPPLVGQLIQRDGAPASSVEVSLYELEDEGTVQHATLLATATTAVDGTWQWTGVSVPEGTFVEARALVNGSPVIFDFRIPTGNAPEADTPLVLQEGSGRVSVGDPATVSASTASTYPDNSTLLAGAGDVEGDEDATGPNDAPDMGLLDATPDDVGVEPAVTSCNYGWFAQDKYKKVWVPLKVSRTLNHSRLHYSFSTSKQSDLGIAFHGSTDAYSAGIEGSRSEKDELTISPDWPHDTSKLVKMQWRYRRYRAWCYGGPPPSTPPTPLNMWKWRPYEPMEFTKPVANNPTFSCDVTGPVNSKIVLSNQVTVGWRNWYSVTVKPPKSTASATVELDNDQTQTTSTSLTIDPDSGETARYCGSATSLANSAFVREIP